MTRKEEIQAAILLFDECKYHNRSKKSFRRWLSDELKKECDLEMEIKTSKHEMEFVIL